MFLPMRIIKNRGLKRNVDSKVILELDDRVYWGFLRKSGEGSFSVEVNHEMLSGETRQRADLAHLLKGHREILYLQGIHPYVVNL